MQTKNLIQAATNVIKITRLQKGDVYKRVLNDAYKKEDVCFGVVIDILNDGEHTYLETLEYTKDYSNYPKAEVQIHSGDKDLALFPATVDEVRTYLKDSLVLLREQIQQDRKALDDKHRAANKAQEFVSGELSKTLAPTQYTELNSEPPKEIE